MSLKKKLFIGIGIVAALGVAWYFWGRAEPESAPTETVKRGRVVETVSVSGELVPQTYADLSFPGAGIVDMVMVSEGEWVKRGTLLATLDRGVLLSQLRDVQTTLAIAEENERLARRQWSDLKPEERAVKKLATEQSRERVRTVKEQLSLQSLLAPFDGRVTRVNLRAHEVAPLGTVGVRLVQDEAFRIEARVPESDIAKIALGMEASVTFDALRADEIFQAVVEKMNPSATVIQGVVAYTIELTLPQMDARLRDGMTADIDIETKKRDQVLTLPFRALSKEGGKHYAEVLRNGVGERVEVVVGLEGDDGTLEILSGLKEGDIVTIGAKQQK